MFTFRLSSFVFKSPNIFRCIHKIGKKHKLANIYRHASSIRNFSVAQDQQISSDSDSDEENAQSKGVTDLKLQILKAGLNFVPEHGWSKQSIAYGANSIGLSNASHSLIQDGGVDLVHFFNITCNEKLEDYLKTQYSSTKEKPDIQNYLEDALKTRLEMVVPYVSKWPEALALMVNPLQFPVASKNLLDLVDIIWYYSGDRSLDLTWYSKRMSLALMYKMCELSLVQDKSPEFSDTFDFLERRIEMVLDSNNILNQVSSASKHLPEFGAGAVITIRNILGVNRWFR